MSVAILSMILLGAGLPVASGQPIGYQVKVHEMEGLEWRSAFHARITQIARPGRATVWVAPRDTAAELAARATRVLFAPKVVGEGGVPGSIKQITRHPYVADLVREANGPVDQSTSLLFKPTVDYWEESLSADVQCKRVESGVLTALKLEETHLISMVGYLIGEQVKVVDAAGNVQLSRLNGQIQVPEVATGSINGEWLIPNEHSLIVSLGVHTVLRDGKGPVVTERVAVVTPEAAYVLPEQGPPLADKAMTLAATPVNSPANGKLAQPGRKKVAPPLPIGESGQWVAADSDSPQAVSPSSTSSSVSPVVINAPDQGAIVVIIPAKGQGTAELAQLALRTMNPNAAAQPAATAADSAPPPPEAGSLPAPSSPAVDSVPPPAANPPVTPDPPVSPFAGTLPVPTDPNAGFSPPLPSVSLPVALDTNGNVLTQPPGDDAVSPVGLPGQNPVQGGPALPSPSSPPSTGGPEAVSLPPIYQAQRKLKITGTFHDGEGWEAITEGKTSTKNASERTSVRVHACDSEEECQPSAPDQASMINIIRQRLTTSVGITADGTRVRESLVNPHRPTATQMMGYGYASSIGTEIAACLLGNTMTALPLRMTQIEIGLQIGVHLYRCGRQPVVFLGRIPMAYRDVELIRTSEDVAIARRSLRTIGLTLGSPTVSVRAGQFPGTIRVRLPIGGLFAAEFRNDVRPAECRTTAASE